MQFCTFVGWTRLPLSSPCQSSVWKEDALSGAEYAVAADRLGAVAPRVVQSSRSLKSEKPESVPIDEQLVTHKRAAVCTGYPSKLADSQIVMYQLFADPKRKSGFGSCFAPIRGSCGTQISQRE
jgi:hypothetical protein